MVVIGVDSHKRTHTVVAVDGNGRKLAEKTAATSPEGHLELIRWARRWRDRTWALEDCRHLTRRLEADLLKGGEQAVRATQAHGWHPTQHPSAWQERPDRRPLGCPSRAP
jgi:transposase